MQRPPRLLARLCLLLLVVILPLVGCRSETPVRPGPATASYWNRMWTESPSSQATSLDDIIKELAREIARERNLIVSAQSVDPLALHFGHKMIGLNQAIQEWLYHIKWMEEHPVLVWGGMVMGGNAVPKLGQLTRTVTLSIEDINKSSNAVYTDLRKKYASESFLPPSTLDAAPFQSVLQQASQSEAAWSEGVSEFIAGFAKGFVAGLLQGG